MSVGVMSSPSRQRRTYVSLVPFNLVTRAREPGHSRDSREHTIERVYKATANSNNWLNEWTATTLNRVPVLSQKVEVQGEVEVGV